MTDDRLDRAIDRAVRDIMSADPPAGLRRRVLERLEGPTARQPIAWWRPAVYGAALVATLVMAVLLFRPDPATPPRQEDTVVQAPQPPATPGTEVPAGAPSPAADAPQAPVPTPRAVPRRPRLSRETLVMPPVADVFGSPSDRVAAANVGGVAPDVAFEAPLSPDLAIAPLPPPAPIVVAPLQTSPIVVPRIEITPIDLRRSQGEKR